MGLCVWCLLSPILVNNNFLINLHQKFDLHFIVMFFLAMAMLKSDKCKSRVNIVALSSKKHGCFNTVVCKKEESL